jgi:hypothetical protein
MVSFDMKSYQKEYYKNNKGKLLERSRKFYEDNKEHIKEYQKLYYKKYYQNPENKNKLSKKAKERYRLKKYPHLAEN